MSHTYIETIFQFPEICHELLLERKENGWEILRQLENIQHLVKIKCTEFHQN